MKYNISWLAKSGIAALLAYILTFVMTKSHSVSLFISLIVFLVIVKNNPQYRYMRAGWLSLSLILILQRISFSLVGTFLGADIELLSPKIEVSVIISLILLAAYCFYLDSKLNSNLNENKTENSSKTEFGQQVINYGNVNKQVNINDSHGDINL